MFAVVIVVGSPHERHAASSLGEGRSVRCPDSAAAAEAAANARIQQACMQRSIHNNVNITILTTFRNTLPRHAAVSPSEAARCMHKSQNHRTCSLAEHHGDLCRRIVTNRTPRNRIHERASCAGVVLDGSPSRYPNPEAMPDNGCQGWPEVLARNLCSDTHQQAPRASAPNFQRRLTVSATASPQRVLCAPTPRQANPYQRAHNSGLTRARAPAPSPDKQLPCLICLRIPVKICSHSQLPSLRIEPPESHVAELWVATADRA